MRQIFVNICNAISAYLYSHIQSESFERFIHLLKQRNYQEICVINENEYRI